MSQRMSVLYNRKPCYDIVFQQSFQGLVEELETGNLLHKKICIVTDSNVDLLYSDEIIKLLEEKANSIIKFVFPAGEEHKNLDTVRDLYMKLIEAQFQRKDLLIALGGGVVGDLTGFAASTYLRGIDFIQIPTTLLSQVDSSIGGKTGVDFNSYKNMVGAFHMPKLVYMNFNVLKDLDERQYFAGMGEVMKHGLIRDSLYYEWLIENLYEINERDMNIVEEMVFKSCQIKKNIVEKDPLEQGERALLNFGHTIGHAIEKAMDFKLFHGECVALGCIAAAYISRKRNLLSSEEYYEIRDMFVPFNLPISLENINPDEVLMLTKSDKKMEADHIKFVLLKKVGKAAIYTDVTDAEILNAIQEIYYNEENYR